MKRPAVACDEGVATVWAATAVGVILTAMLFGLHLGAAVLARHRAESAADLAALAAAGQAVQGVDAACARARQIVAAMDGRVASCRLSGWNALVEVEVAVPMPLVGGETAIGRAAAGPVT